jgi:hypothetical protein
LLVAQFELHSVIGTAFLITLIGQYFIGKISLKQDLNYSINMDAKKAE